VQNKVKKVNLSFFQFSILPTYFLESTMKGYEMGRADTIEYFQMMLDSVLKRSNGDYGLALTRVIQNLSFAAERHF
jgi:hypothetical protein